MNNFKFATKAEFVDFCKEEAARAEQQRKEEAYEAERLASGLYYGSPLHAQYGDSIFGAVGYEEHCDYSYDEYQGEVDIYAHCEDGQA